MQFLRRLWSWITRKQRPVSGKGAKALSRKQRRMQKAEIRRHRKKITKATERMIGSHPAPTKAKPTRAMMQRRDAREQVEVLRAANHQLAKKLTEMSRLAGITVITESSGD